MYTGITQTSESTGLSPWELRTGAQSGKYPHIRTGNGGKGSKYLFDIEKVKEIINTQENQNMLNNKNYVEDITPFSLIKKQA